MNLGTLIKIGTSIIRNVHLKLWHGNAYKCTFLNSCSMSTKIIIHKGAEAQIGYHLSTLERVVISCGSGAKLIIGNNVNLNTDCEIVAKNNIEVGNDVIFGPGCKIYDHDHDYKKVGVDRRTNFVVGTVKIGNGVWFGANCIVLRDTSIGDNCVFGAGSVIKGHYPENVLVVQERTEKQKQIGMY